MKDRDVWEQCKELTTTFELMLEISFRCPDTVHLLIKLRNCSDFSCLFPCPKLLLIPTPASWDFTLEGFLLFLIPLSVKGPQQHLAEFY